MAAVTTNEETDSLASDAACSISRRSADVSLASNRSVFVAIASPAVPLNSVRIIVRQNVGLCKSPPRALLGESSLDAPALVGERPGVGLAARCAAARVLDQA